MKKRKLLFLLTAILIVLVLAVCGCGKKKEDVKPAPTETKQAANDETKTETKEEKTDAATEAQTEEQYDDEDYGPSDAQCVQITMTLLGKLQNVTRVGAGAVQKDNDTVYYDPETGFAYNLVTDPNITSFYDIYQMLYSTFTQGCIEDRWLFMIQPSPGNAPYFQFVQDQSVPTGIYIIQAGAGYLDYTPTGDISIEHLDDRHFIATVPFESFNAPQTLIMDVVLEDNDWKINGFHVE